jgi:hypothetical protein
MVQTGGDNAFMEQLKLAALDGDDLAIISAHLQDAVLKVADLKWQPGGNRFLLTMNRFVWEKENSKSGPHERRRSMLHFNRVTSAKTSGIRQDARQAVLELLALRFEVTDDPSGTVTIVFAGGGAIALEVECIEAQLSDLGAAWSTENLPVHQLDD